MEDEIILIAGRTNIGTQTLFWKIGFDTEDVDVGDYAIVENLNGYDLVQIAGFVKTNLKKAHMFSNTKYENMKNVILVIHKEEMKLGESENDKKIIS